MWSLPSSHLILPCFQQYIHLPFILLSSFPNSIFLSFHPLFLLLSLYSSIILPQCGKVHQNAITPKKFPSNHTTKICEILTLQMDDFLPLGGISGLFTLNEFERTGFLLHFIVKKIFWINEHYWRYSLPKISKLWTLQITLTVRNGLQISQWLFIAWFLFYQS